MKVAASPMPKAFTTEVDAKRGHAQRRIWDFLDDPLLIPKTLFAPSADFRLFALSMEL